MHFVDILEIFCLDESQISFNLRKKAFATWQHAFLSTSTIFCDSFVQVCTEIKIWSFWMRKRPTCLGFSVFSIFFTFPFVPFLIFLRQLLAFYRAYFQFQNFWESTIATVSFYHGVATSFVSDFAESFARAFFTQISEHFHAYLRLN